MNNILYRVGDNLYINLTNRCPCACTFCLRQSTDTVGASDSLWLKEEPDFDTVKAEFSSKNLEEYDEVVFCGFGEPTERLALLLSVADFVKAEYHKPVRLNTNGLGDLINGRKIAPELQNRVDTVSISLNTPDRDDYLKLVRPKFGPKSFDAMLSFAEDAVKYVPHVVLTTVETTITREQEAECAEICRALGAEYRIRAWV